MASNHLMSPVCVCVCALVVCVGGSSKRKTHGARGCGEYTHTNLVLSEITGLGPGVGVVCINNKVLDGWRSGREGGWGPAWKHGVAGINKKGFG